jgi:hypothetical protein
MAYMLQQRSSAAPSLGSESLCCDQPQQQCSAAGLGLLTKCLVIWMTHVPYVYGTAGTGMHQKACLVPPPCLRPRISVGSGFMSACDTKEKHWQNTPSIYFLTSLLQARAMIESSTACKCPSVTYQLAGSKKVQQDLAMPGVVERFVGKQDGGALRQLFAGELVLT